MRQQRAHDGVVASIRCTMEWGVPSAIPRVDGSSAPQERL
eukprot:CAMPEP_0174699758 /NCGR_PEP_ID=MMETSP1094-20130205/4936_1 /TAXON_ID=156173 /ORGANISM="Chrysochromulina brevifilum, Strain UTEX LB 985" /LENGTH=39 /DNA_ID= /DNA_START= /DNA_END= /DNA_ORIENTATION=